MGSRKERGSFTLLTTGTWFPIDYPRRNPVLEEEAFFLTLSVFSFNIENLSVLWHKHVFLLPYRDVDFISFPNACLMQLKVILKCYMLNIFSHIKLQKSDALNQTLESITVR